jgi:hypothetical protein
MRTQPAGKNAKQKRRERHSALKQRRFVKARPQWLTDTCWSPFARKNLPGAAVSARFSIAAKFTKSLF